MFTDAFFMLLFWFIFLLASIGCVASALILFWPKLYNDTEELVRVEHDDHEQETSEYQYQRRRNDQN